MTKKYPHSFKSLLLLVSSSMAILGCQSNSSSAIENESSASVNQKVMAYARFVPERQDDFAWENDKVAFRVYGPAAPLVGHSSGIDIWLKKVDYSIINKWYNGHVNGISYHVDRGEGYDPYHTGISRGVGGLAIWIDNKPYYAHNFKSYKVIESGNEKAIFNLVYEWETPLGIVHETRTVSLALGSQLSKIESTFKLNGKVASLPIAVGIATHDEKAKVSYNQNTGRISAWEVIDQYGLGTGAVLDPKTITDIKHIPSKVKDESHIWAITRSDEQGKLTYYTGFTWEAAGEITNFKDWEFYLDHYKQ